MIRIDVVMSCSSTYVRRGDSTKAISTSTSNIQQFYPIASVSI